jgi:hypothetical protein
MLKKFSVFRDLNKFIFFDKSLEICVNELDGMVKLHHNRDRPKSYFTKEKQFEYFHHLLIKSANILIIDKGMCIVYIHKKSVGENSSLPQKCMRHICGFLKKFSL